MEIGGSIFRSKHWLHFGGKQGFRLGMVHCDVGVVEKTEPFSHPLVYGTLEIVIDGLEYDTEYDNGR